MVLVALLVAAAGAPAALAWQGSGATPAQAAEATGGWQEVLAVIMQLTAVQWIYLVFSILGAWLLGCFLTWVLGVGLKVRPGVAARVGLVIALVAFGLFVPLVFFPQLVNVGLPVLGIAILSGVLLIFAIVLLLGLFVV